MIAFNGDLDNIPEFEVAISDRHYCEEIVAESEQEPFRRIPLPSGCRCNRHSCWHCRKALDVWFAEITGSLFGPPPQEYSSIAFCHEYKYKERTLIDLDLQTLGLRGAKCLELGGLKKVPWLGVSDLVVSKCFPNDGEEKWLHWCFMITSRLPDDLQAKLRNGMLKLDSVVEEDVSARQLAKELTLDCPFPSSFAWWRRHVEKSVAGTSHRAQKYRNEFLSKGCLGDSIIAIAVPQFDALSNAYH